MVLSRLLDMIAVNQVASWESEGGGSLGVLRIVTGARIPNGKFVRLRRVAITGHGRVVGPPAAFNFHHFVPRRRAVSDGFQRDISGDVSVHNCFLEKAIH